MPDTAPSTVKFFYVKSNAFRVAHVDGAIAGITPPGNMHCAFYSERPAIPQMTEVSLSPEGGLGDLLWTEGKEGVVREIDIDIQLSASTAAQLRDLFGRILSQLQEGEQ